MADDKRKHTQEGQKRDPLEQLVSVAIPGSSVQSKPGTDPDNI